MKFNLFIIFTGVMIMTNTGCNMIQGLESDNVLNRAAGKVFDVNLNEKSFRFLKQDVGYESIEVNPWYKVYWNNDTVLMQSEKRRNLSGLKDPVIVIFSGLDEENAKAFKEGKSFRADYMVLRPDLKDTKGLNTDDQTVVGWFTPREAKFSRDGKLKLGDKEIDAGVKRGEIRIEIKQKRTPEEMAKGFWKATLKGTVADGRFVADEIQLEPLKDPFALDDPKLPRVLSVGDSISINYEPATREYLKGIANYYRIEDNCWSTRRGVAFMPYWLGDYTRKGLGWDLILFNSGMHDMKQKVLGGSYAVPLDEYKQNLKKEIEIMKKTGARLLFITTTPVPNDLGSEKYAFRTKSSEKFFNQAALEVLKEYPGIEILDLAKVVEESPVMKDWWKGKDVHYWNKEEQEVLGKAVSDKIKEILSKSK
jgi:hypothetical protein